MKISMIAAMSENRMIGKDGKLLWHLPIDMKHFKDTTNGHPVVMGRKTCQAFERPLPNRKNIVITRQEDFHPDGTIVVHSIEEGLEKAKEYDREEIFIIGGGEIYQQALPHANFIYLTIVHHQFNEGDTVFPKLDSGEWLEVKRNFYEPDEQHEYPFSILFLQRKQ